MANLCIQQNFSELYAQFYKTWRSDLVSNVTECHLRVFEALQKREILKGQKEEIQELIGTYFSEIKETYQKKYVDRLEKEEEYLDPEKGLLILDEAARRGLQESFSGELEKELGTHREKAFRELLETREDCLQDIINAEWYASPKNQDNLFSNKTARKIYQHLCLDKVNIHEIEKLLKSSKTVSDWINEQGLDGSTLLHHAVAANQQESVRLLLNYGADPSVKNAKQDTPLHWAAKIGNYGIAKALVENNKKVINERGNESRTPFHIAVFNNHTLVVLLFLEKGGDVNKEAVRQGECPFSIAIQRGNIFMVGLLARNQWLQLTYTNQWGEAPLFEAVEAEFLEAIPWILNHPRYMSPKDLENKNHPKKLLEEVKQKIKDSKEPKGIRAIRLKGIQDELKGWLSHPGTFLHRSYLEGKELSNDNLLQLIEGGGSVEALLKNQVNYSDPDTKKEVESLLLPASERLRLEIEEENDPEGKEFLSKVDQVGHHLLTTYRQKESSLQAAIADVSAGSPEYRAFQRELRKMESAISRLEANQSVLCALQEPALWKARQKAWIEANPKYEAFYVALCTKFVEFAIAHKALASGVIQRKANTKWDQVGKGVLIAGSLLSLTPITLPVQAVAKGIQLVIKKKVDQERAEHAKAISELFPTLSEIDQMAIELATKLTFDYQHQLNSLTPKGAKQLGECAIGRIMIYIDKERPKRQDPNLLIETLLRGMQSLRGIRQGKKLSLPGGLSPTIPFLKTAIELDPKTITSTPWSEAGVFERCGIRLEDKRCFSYNDKIFQRTKHPFEGKHVTHVTKYKHRLGSKEEIDNNWTLNWEIKKIEESASLYPRGLTHQVQQITGVFDDFKALQEKEIQLLKFTVARLEKEIEELKKR